MSGFSMQDMLNLSNKSLAEGLAEGAALRDELAEALRNCLTVIGLANWEGCPEHIAGVEALAKYEASKS